MTTPALRRADVRLALDAGFSWDEVEFMLALDIAAIEIEMEDEIASDPSNILWRA